MTPRRGLAAALLMALGMALLGQTPTGSISGIITDSSGAVVPGAKVTITDVGKGISRSVTTDGRGRYQEPGLIPGNYEIQAQMEGFQTEIRRGIQLTVGMDAVINLSLQVGQVAQTTVVTGEAPLVETVTGTVSGLVDDRAIRDLPLNGRSFDQLIGLQSSTPMFHNRATTAATGRSAIFSMSGARGNANVYLMDGTEVVGASYSNVTPGSILGKNMGVEAIQEFSVLTSNYSAAYGKRGGGVINMATRSGTNQLHGSGYGFLRNDDLDARNFFDTAKPEFRRAQFGGAIGGPIQKDKTFFFGNYEGLRESLGLTSIAIVPDDNSRQAAVASVQPFLVMFPRVNGRLFGDGTGEALGNPNQISRQDFFLIRVDHKISDKDSLFARYNFTDASILLPDADFLFATTNPGRDQILTLQETRAYATFLNVIRAGYTRSNLINEDLPQIPIDPSLVFIPGAKVVGAIAFGTRGGLGGVGNAITSAGPSGATERFAYVNQFEVNDQVNYYLGAHSLQFGAKYQRIQHNDRNPQSIWGQFMFSSLADFLAARPLQFVGPQPGVGSDSTKGWRQHYFATFFQDDVKLLPNFTLNLGVRWEFMTAPTEVTNRISNYRAYLVNGLSVLDTQPFLGSPFFYTNYGTVAPRVGFAWDTFGNGKMAVRGGFGIYYDQIEKDPMSVTGSNPPFYQNTQVTNPNFPLGFSGSAGSAGVASPNGIDVHADAGTEFIYNLGIEREITTNTLFKIGYVGSHGYHLTGQSDLNTLAPQILPGGVYFYPAGAPRKNPLLGSSRIKMSDAGSSYNSVQMDLIQRFSHGLRYKLSYTFAKTIDNASSDSGPDALNSAGASQNPVDLRPERGLSAFDIRHSFAANFTYDLPGQNLRGATGRLAGGWQVGSIITASSGFPVDILTGFNRSRDGNTAGTSDRPNLAPGASNSPVQGAIGACSTNIPAGQKLQTPDHWFDPCAFALPPAGFYGNLGRNTLIGPGFFTVDFTLVKTMTVTERLKMDFRAEFFNILNRANFGLPNQNIFQTSGDYVGSAGRVSTTTSSSRQIQFGLKLLF